MTWKYPELSRVFKSFFSLTTGPTFGRTYSLEELVGDDILSLFVELKKQGGEGLQKRECGATKDYIAKTGLIITVLNGGL